MALLDLNVESVENTFSPRVVLFGVEETASERESPRESNRDRAKRAGKVFAAMTVIAVALAVAVWLVRRR